MAENHVSTRPSLARKPHRYQVDEGLDVRFLCHANSTHVLQTLWRGLTRLSNWTYATSSAVSQKPRQRVQKHPRGLF